MVHKNIINVAGATGSSFHQRETSDRRPTDVTAEFGRETSVCDNFALQSLGQTVLPGHDTVRSQATPSYQSPNQIKHYGTISQLLI